MILVSFKSLKISLSDDTKFMQIHSSNSEFKALSTKRLQSGSGMFRGEPTGGDGMAR